MFCDHVLKCHDQPVLKSIVIKRRNFKLITLRAHSLHMDTKGMDEAKAPHDKGVLITGVGNTWKVCFFGSKKTTPNLLTPNMHLPILQTDFHTFR